MNLDLGIETYFTDGLNPWLLGKYAYMAAVCVSCLHLDHHCIHSCYFPIVGNSVQVLGMELLLSSTKILCPLHRISTLLWWSIARIVICLYSGNTQCTSSTASLHVAATLMTTVSLGSIVPVMGRTSTLQWAALRPFNYTKEKLNSWINSGCRKCLKWLDVQYTGFQFQICNSTGMWDSYKNP